MADTSIRTGLAWKLILAFTLSMGLIGFAAWFAYDNFNRLLGSVQTLSNPERSTEMFQELIQNMHKADNDMRNYIMSNDNASLQSYIEVMEQISVDLDNMKQEPSLAPHEETLDSLEEFFQDKADLMYSLVIFKQSGEYERLNSKALKTLSGKSGTRDNGSVVTPSEKTSTPEIKTPAIQNQSGTTEKSNKKDKNKKKDEGFLRNLFGSKKSETTQPAEEPIVVSLKDSVSRDNKASGYTIDLAETPSVEIEDVRSILKEIDAEQKRYNTRLTEKELEILTSDKLIIHKVDEIIARLQIQQEAEIAAQVAAAQKNAHRSSRTMFIIAAAALLTGLVFLTVIIMDIVRSNRYKQQLIEARNRAQYLAKAKEDFLANMSHEIRTPLNAIIGFSEQIEHTHLQPEQQRYIKAVSNAGTHLLNTVNDILDLSKIEAGKLPIQEQPLRMREVLEEIVSILSVKSMEKNLPLSLAVGEMADVPVMGDSFRIRQLLYNIAGNAIKFTERGFVEISCAATKTRKSIQYEITVRDTGIGIAEEKLSSIFEIFEQAESNIARKYGGTGLGLSISKKLAEIMGGSITVKSKVGEGTEFTVSLPLRMATEEEAAEAQQEHRTTVDLKGLEILLVDDEPYNLMLAEVILKKFGANSTSAVNGKEALELIDVRNFDIVFADLHMPEVDGYMLANKIRERYLQVPLIALTANVMQNDLERIRRSGFNDILLKPYKESALLAMINKYAPVVIGKDELRIEEELTTSPQEALYALEEVLRFADNDELVLASIIETFLQSNRHNLQLMQTAIAEKDADAVRNIAHKMLPSYNHFGIHAIVPALRDLESWPEAINAEVHHAFEHIRTHSETVFAELEKELAGLPKENV